MTDSSVSDLPDDVLHPSGLLETLLKMSLTAVAFLRPLYEEENGENIRDFAWVRLNQAGQQMLGQPEQPAVSLRTLFPSAQANGVFAVCCQAFMTGKPCRNQTSYRVEGLDSYFLLVAQRYENLVVVNFTDTNDRPQSAVEQALRESQAQAQAAHAEAERQRGELERVFEQAPAAIAVYRGPQYTIELANSTVARLWGRTREELLGKGLFEALPEVAGLGYEELLDGVMATGVPYVAHAMKAQHEREGRLDTVYWDFVYVPTYEADGRINGAMVVATEVTAQVLARQQIEQLNQELETRVQERTRQLSEQQQALRHILGQVPAFIATLSGPEHRYAFFNEMYQSLSANRAVLGLSVAEVFPEVIDQGFIDLLDQVYNTGEPFIGTAVPAMLHDAALGQTRQYYVDFIYQPLFDEQQQVRGILAFILDVTDRALARQQVEESQQQVQALNQELAAINAELTAINSELHESNVRLLRTNADLDTFVYAASHDLKSPIANIEGLLDVLREYLPSGDQQPMVPRLVEMIQGAISRFQQTVGYLTEVARLQHDTHATATEVDIPGLLEDVRLDLLPLLESTHTHLSIEVQACSGVRLPHKNMRSVLSNLLSNAIKYRSPDRAPVVQVRSQCTATQFVLEVQDNGLGLNPEQLRSLFTMFRRLHTHVEGSGVGLYLIKRMIELAGGTITVHSEPEVGSTFTVTLPHA